LAHADGWFTFGAFLCIFGALWCSGARLVRWNTFGALDVPVNFSTHLMH
jgi:hypothetical protein